MLFVFINLFVTANDTIKIEYKSLHSTSETSTLADIVSFLGLDYREIIITGNISNKNFTITTHLVKDGNASIYRIDKSIIPIPSDTLTIYVKSLPNDSNKVKLRLTASLG